MTYKYSGVLKVYHKGFWKVLIADCQNGYRLLTRPCVSRPCTHRALWQLSVGVRYLVNLHHTALATTDLLIAVAPFFCFFRNYLLFLGSRCSSVFGRRIDHSRWAILFPASVPRMVYQKPWYVLTLGMVHIKEPLLLIEKSSSCSGSSGFPLWLSWVVFYYMSDAI